MSPVLQAYFYLYSLSHTGSPQWAGKLVNMEPENKEDWPYLHSKSRKTYNLLRKALALSLSDALLWGEHLYISDRFIIWCFKEETGKKKKKKRSASGHLGPEGDTGSFLLPALVLGPSVCREMSPAHSLPVLIPFQELILCVCHISFGLSKHRLLDERGRRFYFLSSCCCLTSYNNSGLIYPRRCNS